MPPTSSPSVLLDAAPPSAQPTTIPAYFQAAVERVGRDRSCITDRNGSLTIGQILDSAAAVAQGLRRRGLSPGDRVGLWADNSRRWLATDLAIQAAGAISVPRGTDTPDAEIAELLAHAEVGFVFVHDAKTAARLERIRGGLPGLRDVVVLDPTGVHGLTFDRLAEEGAGGPPFAEWAAKVGGDDVATIIYTSGTTGRPKGVVLAQSNFAHQMDVLPKVLGIGADDVFLSILPPWHIFERTVEYVALSRGARLVITDRRRFREDLQAHSPTFVPSVPRLWEPVHDAARKSLADSSPIRRAAFAAAYFLSDLRARAVDRWKGHVRRVRRGIWRVLHGRDPVHLPNANAGCDRNLHRAAGQHADSNTNRDTCCHRHPHTNAFGDEGSDGDADRAANADPEPVCRRLQRQQPSHRQ